MSIVVIDLEWNSGADRIKLDEILQIGAVKLDRLDGPVTGVFSALIRPSVHADFSPAVKHLALTPEELEDGDDFTTAADRFLHWCGEDAKIAAWGPADYRVLRENMRFWKLAEQLPDFYCDLQCAFSKALGLDRSLALCAAVEYCAIPDALDFHNAVNDAFYSALVGGTMVRAGWQDALDHAPLLKTRRERHLEVLPEQFLPYLAFSGRALRGMADEEKLLSSHAIRRQNCPVCGEPLNVSHWFPLDGAWIARSTCPNHGIYYFFCAPRAQEGGWEGWVLLLTGGEPIRMAYAQRDRQQGLSCQGGGKKHRRGKKRKTKGAVSAQ